MHRSELLDITGHPRKGPWALSTTTQDMKLATVALGLGKSSLIMMNCAANLVIQGPTPISNRSCTRQQSRGVIGTTERYETTS